MKPSTLRRLARCKSEGRLSPSIVRHIETEAMLVFALKNVEPVNSVIPLAEDLGFDVTDGDGSFASIVKECLSEPLPSVDETLEKVRSYLHQELFLGQLQMAKVNTAVIEKLKCLENYVQIISTINALTADMPGGTQEEAMGVFVTLMGGQIALPSVLSDILRFDWHSALEEALSLSLLEAFLQGLPLSACLQRVMKKEYEIEYKFFAVLEHELGEGTVQAIITNESGFKEESSILERIKKELLVNPDWASKRMPDYAHSTTQVCSAQIFETLRIFLDKMFDFTGVMLSLDELMRREDSDQLLTTKAILSKEKLTELVRGWPIQRSYVKKRATLCPTERQLPYEASSSLVTRWVSVMFPKHWHTLSIEMQEALVLMQGLPRSKWLSLEGVKRMQSALDSVRKCFGGVYQNSIPSTREIIQAWCSVSLTYSNSAIEERFLKWLFPWEYSYSPERLYLQPTMITAMPFKILALRFGLGQSPEIFSLRDSQSLEEGQVVAAALMWHNGSKYNALRDYVGGVQDVIQVHAVCSQFLGVPRGVNLCDLGSHPLTPEYRLAVCLGIPQKQLKSWMEEPESEKFFQLDVSHEHDKREYFMRLMHKKILDWVQGSASDAFHTQPVSASKYSYQSCVLGILDIWCVFLKNVVTNEKIQGSYTASPKNESDKIKTYLLDIFMHYIVLTIDDVDKFVRATYLTSRLDTERELPEELKKYKGVFYGSIQQLSDKIEAIKKYGNKCGCQSYERLANIFSLGALENTGIASSCYARCAAVHQRAWALLEQACELDAERVFFDQLRDALGALSRRVFYRPARYNSDASAWTHSNKIQTWCEHLHVIARIDSVQSYKSSSLKSDSNSYCIPPVFYLAQPDSYQRRDTLAQSYLFQCKYTYDWTLFKVKKSGVDTIPLGVMLADINWAGKLYKESCGYISFYDKDRYKELSGFIEKFTDSYKECLDASRRRVTQEISKVLEKVKECEAELNALMREIEVFEEQRDVSVDNKSSSTVVDHSLFKNSSGAGPSQLDGCLTLS